MRSLNGAQTLVATGPVHALHIYRGVRSSWEVFGMRTRTKGERKTLQLEAARLAKSHRAGGGAWNQQTIDACESIANRWLGHTQGCRSSELRSAPAVLEIPASHLDINALSPITYLYP